MSEEETSRQAEKKVLSPKDQREKDLMPFQSISRTTFLLHFFWKCFKSLAIWFVYLTIINYIGQWLFGWDVLSFEIGLILAAIFSAVTITIQGFRKKSFSNNSNS